MNLKSFAPRNLARHVSERARGLDFLTPIEPETVGLDSTYAHRSSPSGGKYLMNVLNDLAISSQDSIIDVGCGKGSAMRTMLKFPFARVDGIELSEKIAAIAVHNLMKLNAQRSRVFVCDAASFSEYDNYNIVYLYNPFKSSVTVKVMDYIYESINRLDRELIIVYNTAGCHEVVISQGVFFKIAIYPDEWGSGISIYSNCGGGKSRLSGNQPARIAAP